MSARREFPKECEPCGLCNGEGCDTCNHSGVAAPANARVVDAVDAMRQWVGPWRVLVTGGRDYADAEQVALVLGTLLPFGIEVVIHGACSGADTLAGLWAESHEVPVIAVPADWTRFGHAAGPIRNRHMLREHKPTLCVAFGGGRGTHDMVTRCREAGLRIIDTSPKRDLRPRRAAGRGAELR